jgi:nucleotide-binding universal stress UspA family protein
MKILIASSGHHDEKSEPAHPVFLFPWPQGAAIHVLSVAEVVYPVMVGMVPDAVDTTDVEVRTAEEATAEASDVALQFRRMGYAAEGCSAKGDPETAILDHAREWGADLIVVGSHDRTRMERFLIGSVAEYIVKHAPCSVLVLKHCAGA